MIFNLILSQGKEYEGPEDSAGDIAAEKEGYMTGNRVFIYFRNTTELSDWPRVNVSKWPNNPNGLKMTDGIGLLVGAKVYIEDDGDGATVDTIPLTELVDIYTTDHHTLSGRNGQGSHGNGGVGILSCIWIFQRNRGIPGTIQHRKFLADQRLAIHRP